MKERKVDNPTSVTGEVCCHRMTIWWRICWPIARRHRLQPTLSQLSWYFYLLLWLPCR